MQGIHPRTSRMLSRTSRMLSEATSPQLLHHKTLNFPSSIIVKMKNIATQPVMNKEKLKRNNFQ